MDNQINMAESPENSDKVMFISYPQETFEFNKPKNRLAVHNVIIKAKAMFAVTPFSLSLKPLEEMEHVEELSRGTSLFVPVPEVRVACLSQCHPSRPPLPACGPSHFAEELVSLLTASTEGDSHPNLFLEWRTLT